MLYDDLAMALRSNWYLKQTRDMLLHSGEQLPFLGIQMKRKGPTKIFMMTLN